MKRIGRWPAVAFLLTVLAESATAAPVFLGVAAGDASSTEATIWTRVVDEAKPGALELTAQISTNPEFRGGGIRAPVSTDPARDFTAKVQVNGLSPGTRYHYRFVAEGGVSGTGTFKTAPRSRDDAPVRFAFSGDADGRMRPYPAANNFHLLNLDFFIFNGDTIYETASQGSPSVAVSGSMPAPTASGATRAQLRDEYARKYREQLLPVRPGGQAGLQRLFAAQGNYTLMDNHELGSRQYANGGAPAGGPVGDMPGGAGADARLGEFDANQTGSFINKTEGYRALQEVFESHHPILNRGAVDTQGKDPRSDGTPRRYFSQQWGRHAVLIVADDRGYRDIRMKTPQNLDETGARADHPERTMLGRTQLEWLQGTLRQAQKDGTTWKFVALSSPIGQVGPIGGTLPGVSNEGNSGYFPVIADTGKDWMGGYRAERNRLLQFIAENQIQNVVFLSTDDHQNRINEVSYSLEGRTGEQSSYARVPYCFEIVAGPLGADGPDTLTDHSFTNHQRIARTIARSQQEAGIDPIGLDPQYPGLHRLRREHHPDADENREPIDFHSPDSYNLSLLEVSGDGSNLTVHTLGIHSTPAESRLEYDRARNPLREILSFQVEAAPVPPEIDHFIVIYQENWSFDSLYGKFPGANGLSNATAASILQRDRVTGRSIATLPAFNPAQRLVPIQNPPAPLSVYNYPDPRFLTDPFNFNSPVIPGLDTLQPFDLGSYLQPEDLTGDLAHRFWHQQLQINRGAMDSFATWSDNPGLVMSYFDATPMPEGQLGLEFVMCDNFFHSAFGGSFLNHQFLVAMSAPVYPGGDQRIPENVAALDEAGRLLLDARGRVVQDGNLTPIGGRSFASPQERFDRNYAVNSIHSANLSYGANPASRGQLPSQNNSDPNDPARPYRPTIGDRMDEAGVSWKWYSGGWNQALLATSSNPANNGLTGTNALPLFQWHHQPFPCFDNYAPWTNGIRNARSEAHLRDESEFFTDVANHTLPQVSFVKPLGVDNEHPGYTSLIRGQAHVLKIVDAVRAQPELWARTAIIITYDENGGRWDHVSPPSRDLWGPGCRVPTIIASPMARKGYVDHHEYETASILRTIEERFQLRPLNRIDAQALSLAPAFEPATRRSSNRVATSRSGWKPLSRREGAEGSKEGAGADDGFNPSTNPASAETLTESTEAAGGDFNGDGQPDLLLQSHTGALGAWLMKGSKLAETRMLGTAVLPEAGYEFVTSADFDQDGKQDLLFQGPHGHLQLWLMDGTEVRSVVPAELPESRALGWRVATAGEMADEGRMGLILQGPEDGVEFWPLEGLKPTGPERVIARRINEPGWRVVGLADFDGDERSDLVFQHLSGGIGVWLMDGWRVRASRAVEPSSPGPDWKVVSLLDRNGDGKADLLFTNDHHDLLLWKMDGCGVVEAAPTSPANSGETWGTIGP